MKSQVLFFFVAISAVSASHIGGVATLVGPVAPGAAIKGPAAHASIVGPDGSAIAAAADSGAVAVAPVAAGVVTAAVSPGVVAAASPVVVAAPNLLASNLGTVVHGPSGIISTHVGAHGLYAGVPAAVIAPALHGWPLAHGLW